MMKIKRQGRHYLIFMQPAALVFYLAITVFFPPGTASSEVVFYDAVCLKDEKVMLKAVTKGKLFTKGGQMVEFFVNGRSIGRSLSGGDGVAFKEFKAAKTGLFKISVESGKDKDRGFLLALTKGTGLIFIDLAGSVFQPRSGNPLKDSRKVIKAIARRFPVVYLQAGILDIKRFKKLRGEHEFPDAPLLQWKEGDVFEETDKRGLKIKVVIGSPPVIESAKAFKPRAFSFVEAESAEEVQDWEEIGKKMRLVIK